MRLQDVKQTFGSYLRNGPLSDPRAAHPQCSTSYG